MAETTRGFDQSVVCFRARIREKHLTGQFHMIFHNGARQFRLLGNLIEIRTVHQSFRLIADCRGQGWMAVTDRANGDSGAKIKVAFSLIIPQPGSLPLHRDKGKTAVGRQYVSGEISGGAHRGRGFLADFAWKCKIGIGKIW
jgi:hypothetical protein